jgi:hypothetical protein
MSKTDRLTGVTAVSLALLLFASGTPAQKPVDHRIALNKLLNNVSRLSPEVTRHFSLGLRAYLRRATAVVNGTSLSLNAQPHSFAAPRGLAALNSSGPGGTIQVSNPALDPGDKGFTQSTTSSARCGNSVVVGYEDTGALLRTDPNNVFGVPLSLDGVSFSTNSGDSFTDIGFLNPGTFSANALLGNPVVTCSSPTHFQYASILNTTTPDGLDPIIGPSISFSADGGRTWTAPSQAISLDGNTEVADKPWLAVDPTNSRRLYLTYTHVSFLGCTSIELLASTDAGKSWSAPTVIDSSCNYPDVAMLNGSAVVISPGGKVYVAYEVFPVPPLGASFGNNAIYFAYSPSGGKSFYTPYKVADVVPGGDGIELNGHLAVDDYPQIAVDRSNTASRGHIYIAWPDGRNKIVPDANAPSGTYAYPDIFLAKCTTFGRSFKILGAVSPTPKTFRGVGRDQFLPGVAVDKDGHVGVCYYDRRNDSQNLRVDRYCSLSADQGRTWRDLRASTLDWVPAPDNDPLNQRPGSAIGQYDALTSDFLLQGAGFFGAFEVEIGGNPNIVAKKF